MGKMESTERECPDCEGTGYYTLFSFGCLPGSIRPVKCPCPGCDGHKTITGLTITEWSLLQQRKNPQGVGYDKRCQE